MNTIQTTTKQKHPDYGTGAIRTMLFEPHHVATLQTPAVMTPAIKTNFIQNAHPAQTARSSIFNLQIIQQFLVVVSGADIHHQTPREHLEKRRKWRKTDYRQAYMESAVQQDIAWQIKINRESRKLSQGELAKRIGSTQSAISRAEDTTYGRHRIETLTKIAKAFDCALQVKFIPYSKLAMESEDLSSFKLYAKSYDEEIAP